MRIFSRSITIDRPRDEVFDVLRDLRHYPEFFVGITKWDPVGEVEGGLGDRYWILMEVGSIQAGGQVVVSEHVPGERVAWEAEQGTDHTIRFVLGDAGPGTTHVTVEFELRLLGGVLSRLAERLAGSIVKRNLTATLESLRDRCEYGPVHPLDE